MALRSIYKLSLRRESVESPRSLMTRLTLSYTHDTPSVTSITTYPPPPPLTHRYCRAGRLCKEEERVRVEGRGLQACGNVLGVSPEMPRR